MHLRQEGLNLFESEQNITIVAEQAQAEAEGEGLLHRLAEGDLTAFWGLWERHRRYLYGVCLRQMGGIQEDAEDALGNVLIKVWDLLPRYVGTIHNLRAWLTRVTYNLCIDIHRKKKQRKYTKSIDEITPADNRELAYAAESPEEGVIRQEMWSYLYQAINELPPNLHTPFALHFLHEMPYGDIAARLTITPESARKRSQIARNILQRKLHSYLAGLATPARHAEGLGLEACLKSLTINVPPSEDAGEVIPSASTAVRLVTVVMPSGIERSFHLPLDHKPLKLHPKLQSIGKYVQRHPGGWKKRLELAQLLSEAGRWGEAVEEYRQVLERRPTLLGVYLQLGNLLRLLERRAEAVAVYQKALQLVTRDATRHHLGGLIGASRDHYHRAVHEFQQAVQAEPEHPVHWHALGMMYTHLESPLEALRAYGEALRLNPNDVCALSFVPAALRAVGCVREAEQHVHRALELNPENLPSLKWLADYRSRRRLVFGADGRRTRELIRKVFRAAPGAVESYESLAFYHLCRGEWQKGVAVQRVATDLHPHSPAGWLYYARTLFRAGETGAAVEAVKRASALDGQDWEIQLEACRILSSAGRQRELRSLLDAVVEAFPLRWRAWTTAGLGWAEAFQEAERACRVAERAPQLQPRLADAWFQYGRVLLSAGRHREAAAATEEGWKWLPEEEGYKQSAPAAVRLCESYKVLGDVERWQAWGRLAARHVRALIADDPAGGHYWQGKLSGLMDDKTAALQEYLKALGHHLWYPDRQEVRDAIKRLQ